MNKREFHIFSYIFFLIFKYETNSLFIKKIKTSKYHKKIKHKNQKFKKL